MPPPTSSAAGANRQGDRRGQPARSRPHGTTFLVRLGEVGIIISPVQSRSVGASGPVAPMFQYHLHGVFTDLRGLANLDTILLAAGVRCLCSVPRYRGIPRSRRARCRSRQ